MNGLQIQPRFILLGYFGVFCLAYKNLALLVYSQNGLAFGTAETAGIGGFEPL